MGHCGFWHHGGAAFLGGVAGGIIGGAIVEACRQPDVVVMQQQPTVLVQQPVVQQQPTIFVQQPVVYQPPQPVYVQPQPTVTEQPKEIVFPKATQFVQSTETNPYSFETSELNRRNALNGTDTIFKFNNGIKEGHTPEQAQAYRESLENIASKHIASGDRNGDGKLDLDEFKALEANRRKAIDPKALSSAEAEKDVYADAEQIFNNLNTRQKDGETATLSEREMAAYYAFVDNNFDGKFNYSEVDGKNAMLENPNMKTNMEKWYGAIYNNMPENE